MHDRKTNVIIGSLVHKQGNYILPEFLYNLRQIQQNYPESQIILATCEEETANELNDLIKSFALNGAVITYRIKKPDYAQDRIWNIACGREAIRDYVVAMSNGDYLLSLDSDMTYDPLIIEIILREMRNYDLVFSGYFLKTYGIGFAGFGCLMIARKILKKIKIHCCEFKNGEIMFEDNLLEMDAFLRGARIKKGYFLHIKHHLSATEYLAIDAMPMYPNIDPWSLNLLRKIANSAVVRCFFMGMSVILKFNILWNLKIRDKK